jgi:hypothetical protein
MAASKTQVLVVFTGRDLHFSPPHWSWRCCGKPVSQIHKVLTCQRWPQTCRKTPLWIRQYLLFHSHQGNPLSVWQRINVPYKILRKGGTALTDRMPISCEVVQHSSWQIISNYESFGNDFFKYPRQPKLAWRSIHPSCLTNPLSRSGLQ